MDENKIIAKLQAHFNQYIGDDATVIPLNDRESQLISKDMLIEDIHFRLKYSTPDDIAHKALHSNLSDIAAMGGEPQYILLGIAVPAKIQSEWLDQFLESFIHICKEQNLALIGGDTTGSADRLLISITIIGKALNNHIKYRHTAKIGDYLVITGELGHAYIGMQALEQELPELEQFKQKQLKPRALVEQGQWLALWKDVTSMIDISDGLYLEVEQIAKASHLGAEIIVDNLVPSTELLQACKIMQLDPLEPMLIGGEDYQLLLTIDKENYLKIAQDFKEIFGYPLIQIGQIVAQSGVRLIQNGQTMKFSYQAFSHF